MIVAHACVLAWFHIGNPVAIVPENAIRVVEESMLEEHRFPIPEQLQEAVSFWRSLFLNYADRQALFHDREDMHVVWAVIELPTFEDGKLDDRNAQRLMKTRADDLRERLKRLEQSPVPFDTFDSALLALSKRGGKDHLPGAWTRVRVQRGVSNHFRAGLERATEWMPQIKTILAQEDVPLELAALPFVESMFNPKARSAAGAAGIWQLMPSTARGLGLKVWRQRDDRFDIAIATRAAARMLRQNYRSLGSWPLALTAYNHGPNGVRRAVAQVGSNRLVDLIENYNKSTWGFASKNFYAEFLAVLAILSTHPSYADELALSQFREQVATRLSNL